MQEQLGKNRIEWIDCSKGLLMLSVIILHCLGISVLGEAVRGAILSFNMPMFFMLSCITFRFSADTEEWKGKTAKAFRHLIIPSLIMFVHIVIGELILGYGSDPQFAVKKLLSLFFASGIWYDLKNITVPEIGVFWFVFALFVGRSLYDLLKCFIKGRSFAVLVIAISLAGIAAGQAVQLPFSLDVAMAVFPFFYMGEHFNELDLKNHRLRNSIVCILVWIADMLLSYIIMHGYFELACRRYTLFPLCYLGAAAGIILFYYFTDFLCSKEFKGVKAFTYLGRYSMEMLSVHAMDFMWKPLWYFENSEILCVVVRLTSDILFFMAVMLIKKLIKQKGARKA